MARKMSLLAGWLALTAMSPQSDTEQMWNKHGDKLAAQGITKPMLRQAMLWTELQYHLGICLRYIPAADRKFWREWWKDTPLEKADLGKAILKSGDDAFLKGAEDSLSHPLTSKQCKRVADSWMTDMKKAAAGN